MPRLSGLVALIPLAIVFATGLQAIDFGAHWDEDKSWLAPLERSFREGVLLPGRYNYPSLGYWITVLATLPEIVLAVATGSDISETVIAAIYEQPFRLRLRAIFLGISCLSILWIFALALRLSRSRAQAFVAASLLGLSWEVAYHMRWVAPDALLMQFAALTMLGCVGALTAQDGRRWFFLACVAAGLGTGTKYTGGLLLAPVVIAGIALCWREGARGALRRAALLAPLGAVAFVVTFLVTTPGALLETETFRTDIDYEIEHYKHGGHGIYTVEPGADHALRALEYLGGHLLSPYAPLAWALTALALVGAAVLLRARPMLGVILLVFPVTYLAYMATMRVFFVRNLLVLAPFLAVFAARGIGCAFAVARRTPARPALACAVAALFALHATYIARAAERTANRSLERSLEEFAAHALENESRTFAVSPRVWSGLAEIRRREALTNVAPAAGATDHSHYATLAIECGAAYDTWQLGPIELRWFGPREINFRYYPTAWNYDERLLVMPDATARACGLIARD